MRFNYETSLFWATFPDYATHIGVDLIDYDMPCNLNKMYYSKFVTEEF